MWSFVLRLLGRALRGIQANAADEQGFKDGVCGGQGLSVAGAAPLQLGPLSSP